MPIRRTVPLRLSLLLAAAAAPSALHAQPAEHAIVAEAGAFMDAYARDLAAGDREALAARYDRRGIVMMFNGERTQLAWDTLATQYRTYWQPPAAFAWQDIIYEPAGPDAVVVNGHFLWTLQPGAEPTRFRYTSLLVRQDGGLRIRLEDESVMMPPPPAGPPPAP